MDVNKPLAKLNFEWFFRTCQLSPLQCPCCLCVYFPSQCESISREQRRTVVGYIQLDQQGHTHTAVLKQAKWVQKKGEGWIELPTINVNWQILLELQVAQVVFVIPDELANGCLSYAPSLLCGQ